MNARLVLGGVALLATGQACDSGVDGSGVAGDTLLGELSEPDLSALCNYANDQLTEGTFVCDGQSVEVRAADCESIELEPYPASCTATVADFERCAEVIGNDFCAQFSEVPPSECAPLREDECLPTVIDRTVR